MHQRGIVLGAFLLAGGLYFFVSAQQKAANLPPPFATKSVNNGPKVIPEPNAAKLDVPQGFHIEKWAEGFEKPRAMMLGPSNEIILADSGGRGPGSIYVLEGKSRKKILSGLKQPYGLEMWNGYLYVGENDSVKRYRYDSKAMTAGPGEEVVSLAGQGTHHWTRSLLFDRNHEWLYVGVGSGSNNDIGEDPRRAAINRYSTKDWRHEIYASGLRNPIGMRWYPGTDTLWAAVQERDTLGDDLVPDYFTHIQQDGFYGWPYGYIGNHEDPLNHGKPGQRLDLVAKSIVPDVLLGSHVAVLDFLFYTGKQFPAHYQGGAFLAFHGSWNRSMRVGQCVAFIPFRDAKPDGPIEEVVKGWMIAPDQRDVWGRPVGLVQLPDGSLLISEDGNNTIWHLSYSGK